ncbi:unnamed protein product, partial [Mesorhabditis belari]|uniref:SESTD1-like spectrin repeats region domain-containing protein n=1 Tax=Mesorhabditis belari TaxID=2138241 RepID=A0AAF3F6K3_9BILA
MIVSRQPELDAEKKKKDEEESEKKRLLDEHANGVNSLLDWLEGSGEKWLQSLHEIGESRDEARQLVREHEQLTTKSQEVSQQAEELAELAQRLTATAPEHAITLQKFVTFFCQRLQFFMSRVKRQAEMVNRSEKFHEQMSEFSRKTDNLLESLCTDLHCSDLAGAEIERKQLEEKVEQMESIYEEVMDIGAVFAEDLATPEKGPIKGSRNYVAGVAHIRENMAAAKHRRKRCLDLVDVRRLKLEQIIRLSTCERDANQAISWIEELQETLRRDYNQVGCDETELRVLKKDREQLEDTARSTYHYGKELCQVALVLRRSLRMDSSPQKQLADKLEHIWGRLTRALTEHDARTHVCAAFNSACVQILKRIDELDRQAKEYLLTKGRRQGPPTLLFSVERRKLGSDVAELRHIGEMLVAQTNANHVASKEARSAAVSLVRQKVEEVEEKRNQLETIIDGRSVPEEDRFLVRGVPTSILTSTTAPPQVDPPGHIRIGDNESYL